MPETCYTPAELEECHKAYLECALWSSIVRCADAETGDTELNGDAPGLELSADFEEAFYDDLDDFLSTARVAYLIGRGESIWKPGQVGHDFWLTRNGHGAGFWDRSTYGFFDRIGRELTQLCKPYGEVDIYLDDDGHLAHDA